uniref:Uncharacterized protein n=1 Tax=Cacopsylla melanoneura TaxID=428564 RepID=A0A8D9BNW8_9HEMI
MPPGPEDIGLPPFLCPPGPGGQGGPPPPIILHSPSGEPIEDGERFIGWDIMLFPGPPGHIGLLFPSGLPAQGIVPGPPAPLIGLPMGGGPHVPPAPGLRFIEQGEDMPTMCRGPPIPPII